MTEREALNLLLLAVARAGHTLDFASRMWSSCDICEAVLALGAAGYYRDPDDEGDR